VSEEENREAESEQEGASNEGPVVDGRASADEVAAELEEGDEPQA
jgi:hypothetical protein